MAMGYVRLLAGIDGLFAWKVGEDVVGRGVREGLECDSDSRTPHELRPSNTRTVNGLGRPESVNQWCRSLVRDFVVGR